MTTIAPTDTPDEEAVRARLLGLVGMSPGFAELADVAVYGVTTTKAWLRLQPPARTIEELQDQLDRWRAHYNRARLHKALAGQTPYERWAASSPATPGAAIPGPIRASVHTVHKAGCRASFRCRWRVSDSRW